MRPTSSLRSRRIVMEPVTPVAYDFLFKLAMDEQIPWRWQGLTPSYENFPEALWRGVNTQLLLRSATTGAPLGLATMYGANHHHGWAYIMVLLDKNYWNKGWPLEGAALFIEYIFKRFNLRKIYGESADFVFSTFSSGSELAFTVEGRLQQHIYVNGTYRDVLILSIKREDWDHMWQMRLRWLSRSNLDSDG